MPGPVLWREARSGELVMRFEAAVLAAASTARPGAPRWTELIVYGLPSGQYVVSKIGRSLVAHRPTCVRADPHRMSTFLEAKDEARVRRVPCLDCAPEVGNEMDPHTLLERTRYTVLQARNPQALYQILLQGRPGQTVGRPTGAVADVIRQLREGDEPFRIWEHRLQPVAGTSR